GAGGNTRDYHTHLEENFCLGHMQHNYLEELEIRTSKSEAIQNWSWEGNPCKLETLFFDLCACGTKFDFATIVQMEMGALDFSLHYAAADWKYHEIESEVVKEYLGA